MEKEMKRKDFFKVVGLSLVGIFLPKISKAQKKMDNYCQRQTVMSVSAESESTRKTFLKHCFIESRSRDYGDKDYLFEMKPNGEILTFLDGYAIVPREKYPDLFLKKPGQYER